MFNIVGADGKQYGPVTGDQIRQWIREGRANAASQVKPADGTDWKPLSSLAEFADELRGSATVPPQMAAAGYVSSRASNKLAAGLCGILMGGLGIHKFILGYNNAAVLMLVVSLVGGFLGMFCCVTALGPAVMHIIGLIEGIIYLTKSDEEFVRTYVDGRKEWF